MNKILNLIFWLLFSVFTDAALATSKVTLSDVHICCVTCQEAIEHAVLGVKSANVSVDRDKNSITVSASDDSIVQAGLDAVANAGFYGKSDNAKIKINPMASEGNSTNAEFTGFHNCCGGCASSVEEAVKSTAGVQSVKISKRTCQAMGNFNVSSVVNAINHAGFSVLVK